MPTLTKAIQDAGLDREDIAELTGVDAVEVANWLRSGQVPDEHVATIESKIGKPLNAATGGPPRKKTSGSRRRRPSSSRSRAGIGSEAQRALTVCANLVHADESKRQAVRALVGSETDLSTPAGLIEVSEGVMSVNKTTSDAISTLTELIQIDNPIKVGIELGKRDRRELAELHRVSRVLLGKPEEDLPGGEDAPYEVAVLVAEVSNGGTELLKWLTDLTG